MKGTKGLGFPSSRHWGPARQITSGLGIGKHSKEGSFDNWRQPGECSHINGHVLKLPPANSFFVVEHVTVFSLESQSFKFKPEGGGVRPRNGGDVRRPKDAAVVNSLQGQKSLSGTFHGDFRSDEDKFEILYSTLNQESVQDICREFAPVQPLVECCEIELGSWVSQTRQEVEGFDQVRG